MTLPAGWTVWQPNLHAPGNDGPLLYLSNVPLDPDCGVLPPATPHPADAGGRACRSPVSSLPPGGVLVTWYTSRIMFPVPTHGEVIPYGDRETHLSVERPGTCADIAGDVTLDAYMPQGNGTLSNIQVIGCARNPAPEFEREFRALLATLKWSGG